MGKALILENANRSHGREDRVAIIGSTTAIELQHIEPTNKCTNRDKRNE
jgi:hypothetical protein